MSGEKTVAPPAPGKQATDATTDAPTADDTAAVFTRPLLLREGRRPLYVEPVDGTLLQPVTGRPPMAEYLHLLWKRRHFIAADARAKVSTRNSGTLLGRAWLVLSPLMDATVYLVIFGLLLRSSRGIDNFIGYLVIGVFLFQFTSRCLVQGSRSLIAGRALLRSFAFPRAALPVAAVAREALSFAPALATLVVIVLFTRPGQEDAWTAPIDQISWRWLLVPLVLALQLAMNLGLALIAARITTRVRDLSNVITLFTRFWLYGSAVFFSFDRFIDHPTLLQVVQLNPMFIVLDMVRDCLLYAQTPAWESWALLSGWAAALLVVGTVTFWRGEESYGTA
ncbi:ABC transporter permease [Cellulomonas wangleii]|uniref:ABC transporter permease n=1 Tax=Cellulomonas wangleii TaxID=2816956 RepID=UPI0027DBD5B3|nr:ABC transporter permease [Cellulomonas wangleii]